MKIPSLKSLFNTDKPKKERIDPTFHLEVNNHQRNHTDAYDLLSHGDDISGMTISALLGSAQNKARTRSSIYQNFMLMEKDPVVSIALRTHAIAALGGHESKGDIVFIEAEPNASEEEKKFIEELRQDLLETFNKIAFSIAYTGIAFGDSFARTYFEKGKGLVHCVADEQTHPTVLTNL